MLGLVLFVALFVGVIIGSEGDKKGSGAPGSTSAESAENAKKTAPKSKQDPENIEAAVGENAELQDRTLVVNEVERSFTPLGGRISGLEPGNEFVRVSVTLTNTGDESINYNVLDFKVQDSAGVQSSHDSRGESEIPYRVSYGGLAPDGELLGNIVFQVPQGDSGLKLIYDPSTVRGKRSITVTL